MPWRGFAVVAILGAMGLAGCTNPSTKAPDDSTTSNSQLLGAEYDTRVLCDGLLARLFEHSIAICDREIGPDGTEKSRGFAFWYIARDIKGIRGLLDATDAAWALQHPLAEKEVFVQETIAAVIGECERHGKMEETAEERRIDLIGIRGNIVSARNLLKVYYSSAGIPWPDGAKTAGDRSAPSATKK